MLVSKVSPAAGLGRRARAPHRFGQSAAILSILFGAVLAPACSATGAETCASSGPNGAGGNPGPLLDASEPAPAALSFSISETLTLSPGEQRELEVFATPPGAYRVQFALLGPDVNAALDRSEAETDASGSARVTLTAPSTSATFTVKASVGTSISTELGVSVSRNGFATLRVEPAYGGMRSVSSWFASVAGGRSCEELTGTPPPDGDLSASARIADGFPEIHDVPIGTVLAVTLRAGHYIGGCATLQEIEEGAEGTVTVPVTDRPIDLASTRLDVTLGLDEATPEWDVATDQAIETALAALVDGAADDALLLLDAMQTQAAASAFGTARLAESWDGALRELWGASGETRLRDAARRWMQEGAELVIGSDTFVGELGPDEDDAALELLQVAGYPPKEAGFNTPLIAAWSADPSDTLLLGTSLLWVPSNS